MPIYFLLFCLVWFFIWSVNNFYHILFEGWGALLASTSFLRNTVRKFRRISTYMLMYGYVDYAHLQFRLGRAAAMGLYLRLLLPRRALASPTVYLIWKMCVFFSRASVQQTHYSSLAHICDSLQDISESNDLASDPAYEVFNGIFKKMHLKLNLILKLKLIFG